MRTEVQHQKDMPNWKVNDMTKSVVFLKDKDGAEDDKVSFDSFSPDFHIVNVLRDEDRYTLYNIQLYPEADSSILILSCYAFFRT